MKSAAFAILAAAVGGVVAQSAQAANMSICNYYTAALLGNNTASNQYTVLKYLVNTVVIGNALPKPAIPGVTFPNVTVPGILANGTVNGTTVNLLPYFDGGLASTNRSGQAVAVNFLDDGGATPLTMNNPANGNSSNQYFLLTHLYEFFGTLLGCSDIGMPGFASYGGAPSMAAVHGFMDLNYAQVTYFITQVALAAESFGVATADIQAVGEALGMYFNVRCEAPVTLAPALGSQLQSICIAADCPLAANNTCAAYPAAVLPGVANATLAEGLGNSSNTATAAAGPSATSGGTPSTTGSTTGSTSSAAAAANFAGPLAAGALALAAFFF